MSDTPLPAYVVVARHIQDAIEVVITKVFNGIVLTMTAAGAIVLGISAPFVLLYLFVRFVKWAWVG